MSKRPRYLSVGFFSHSTIALPPLLKMEIKLSDSINAVLPNIRPSLSAFNAVVTCTALWAFVKLIRMSRQRLHTTRLRGPPNPSFLCGVGKILLDSDDPASLYESWAREYGSVYAVPSTLGTSRIILYDSKALAHYYAKETWSYGHTPMLKRALENSASRPCRLLYLRLTMSQQLGKGLLSADGESHRRHVLTYIYFDEENMTSSLGNASL